MVHEINLTSINQPNMNAKDVIYLSILLFVNISCSKDNTKNMFPSPDINIREERNITYMVDTLIIDTTMNTTFEGNMGVHDNRLYFIDRLFCTIHFFDSTGKISFRTLGIGRGPTETTIGQIYTHTFLNNGYLCLQGVTDDVQLFDREYKIDRSKSYRKTRKSYKLGDKIGYDQFELYSMGFPLVCRSYKHSVFTNNSAEDPTFNYFRTPDIFVKEFRGITEQRLDKKETGRLLGRGMPDVYKNRSDTHYIFSSTFFDIDPDGNFYVAYMADSLIYKYDKDYNPLYSFGFEGRARDKEYVSVKSVKDIQGKGVAQYRTKGYYTWVEHIDELGYLFRSYSKGEKESSDGLQIYQDRTLIADIDVPKGFKPIGYIKPYLFSDAIVDEGKMRVYVYRVRLKMEC